MGADIAPRPASPGRDALHAAAGLAPQDAGVYVFLGHDDDVLFVGKAGNLRRRLQQHARAWPPTSRLHRRCGLVRRVVWEPAADEAAAAWRESDLIFALRPPFNANPGLGSADPAGVEGRPPFVVVTPERDRTLCCTLQTEPGDDEHTYGCFPHLGKGVSSQLGIACSDGYTALLRLLWAATAQRSTHIPATVTRSAPTSFLVRVEPVGRRHLHGFLSGATDQLVGLLMIGALARPAYMQPGLQRDSDAARRFFAAGPHRLDRLRLRHGLPAGPTDAGTYRQLIREEIQQIISAPK